MTEDNAPGKRNFKVYWETALPVLAVVLTLSDGFSARGRNFLRALVQTGKTAWSAQTTTTAKSWLRSKHASSQAASHQNTHMTPSDKNYDVERR